MPYLEVLFFLCSGLLVLTGVYKVFRPQPTATVLGAVGINRPASKVAITLGVVESAVGALGLASPRGPGGTAVASMYLAFACFLGFLVAFRPSVRSCGCTGRRDTPPNLLHAGLDLAATAIALGVATGDSRTPAEFVRAFGFEGVVALVVAALLGYALYGAVAYLPQALRASLRVSAPPQQGGAERNRRVDDIFRKAGIGPEDPSLWGGIRNGAAVS
jgi:hypothetical protein